MNLQKVIDQLRQNASIFGGRVAGAADFAQATEQQGWMGLPAAYVIPLDEDATPNEFGNGLEQHVTERIGVVVELDNSADRLSSKAVATLNEVRSAVWAALLNWRIDPDHGAQALYYGGGRVLDFDRARLFYQLELCLDRLLTDQEGWQEPTEPLTEIDVDVQVGGREVPGIRIPLPQ